MMKSTEPADVTLHVSTWVRRVVGPTGDTADHPTTHRPAADMTVAEIMTRTTYCVRPDVGVDTLAGVLLERRMSGVPVVDDTGRPIGVVSKTDLVRHMHERGESVVMTAKDDDQVRSRLGTGYHAVALDQTTVADIMTPVVFALAEDVPIAYAAALMAGENIHRVPIVAADGTVSGVLSALDIVRWVADLAGYAT